MCETAPMSKADQARVPCSGVVEPVDKTKHACIERAVLYIKVFGEWEAGCPAHAKQWGATETTILRAGRKRAKEYGQ